MVIFAPPAGGVTLGLVGAVAIVFTFSCLRGGGREGGDANTACFFASCARYPSPVQSAPMPQTLQTTPANDGFSMPAEYAPHAGCWMLWPERPDNWRLGAQPAQRAF